MNSGRVVHLCRGRDWRGGERQVRLLVQSLAERLAEPAILATARNSRLAGALLGTPGELWALPWASAYDPRALVALLRKLDAVPGPRDDLLLHAHDSHALVLGLFASHWMGVPLIATRRSVAIPGAAWRRADVVIAISRAVEQALLAGGVPRGRIRCIPSAVPVAELRARYPGADAGGNRIVAIGALTAEKGHANLVEAFALLAAALPGARLLIVGDGPERGALTARVARLGLTARVELPGEQEDPLGCLAGARVFAQPSLREALGTAVLEAMALGVPVVASRTGGLCELLAGGAGLLVPPDDPAALAQAIESLFRDPAQCTALAATASLRVLEYDARGMADRVAEVYGSALGDT